MKRDQKYDAELSHLQAPERKRRPVPDFIERVVIDISRDLGDNPRSVKSSITRATKIWYTALLIFPELAQNDPEGLFTEYLYAAKSGALKVNNIRHHTGARSNRMPEFFTCLENLFGFRQEDLNYLRSDEPLYHREAC